MHLQMKELSSDRAFAEIERCMYSTLETYANVHRGAGFKSLATTAIYEQARDSLLDAAGLDRERFKLIFCHPGMDSELMNGLSDGDYRLLTSAEIGLPLGVRALAVERTRLAALKPPLAGGGTVDIVLPRSFVWSEAPALFEAGTPAVVNIAGFVAALRQHVSLDARVPALTVDAVLGGDDLGDGPDLLRSFRRSLIGRHFTVPTDRDQTGFINLDNAASTPAPWSVWESARKALRLTADARGQIVSAVKAELAAFLGAPSEEYEVLFTVNATGAINLAARTLASTIGEHGNAIIVNTWFEHNSNELPWRLIPGTKLRKAPLAASGLVDMAAFERMMKECNHARGRGAGRVALVAMNGASNVTGEPADIETMCAIAHRYGAMTLVDGSQLFSHRPLDLKRIGADFFAFSGHKAYAPFGAGALVARRSCMAGAPPATAAMKSAGEENVVGIAAIGKAVRLLSRIGMETIQNEEARLHRLLVRGFSSRPGIKVLSADRDGTTPSAGRCGATAIEISGIPHNLAARLLAEAGAIGTRSGCFCAHLFVQRLLGIHPLRAWLAGLLMKVSPAFGKSLLPGLVRVSIGAENDESDLDALFTTLDRIMTIPQSPFVRTLSRIRNGIPVLPDTSTGRKTEDAIQERLRNIFPSPVKRSRTCLAPFSSPCPSALSA